MSRISDLVAKLATIPDKEKRATQLGDMVAVRDKLKASAENADRLRVLNAALEKVEGADFVPRAGQGLAQAANAANKFKARFANGAGFERKKADEALTAINERIEAALNVVEKGWQTLVDSQGLRFKPLAEAAERAELTGAEHLKAAIDQIAAWRDQPPATPQAAAAFVADAERIPASITQLGLEGRAGLFMVAAANGRGRAKDLQDFDVLKFLNEHPAVWSMLKVSL